MSRKILIAPSGNHRKKRNEKTLSRNENSNAIISKIFSSVVGTVIIFSVIVLLFGNAFTAMGKQPSAFWFITAITVCIIFNIYIFSRSNNEMAKNPGYTYNKHACSRNPFDPHDSRNFYSIDSPYYIKDNASERY